MGKMLVTRHVWKNGQAVSAFYHDRKPKKAQDPSDVILFEIKPGTDATNRETNAAQRETLRLFMNIEDCTAIIHALSAACVFAIRDRQPVGPER